MHKLIGLIPLLLLATPGVAIDIPLTAYQASYALYRGDLNVANSAISLERSDHYWRWRQTSKAKGIYALFSNKTLYTETTLLRLDDQYKIHNILLRDEGKDERYENARFDWSSRQVDIQYKNKRYQKILEDQVRDSRSIHLLAAQMLKHNLQEAEFYFYGKGKLAKSQLKQTGKTTLEISNKTINVSIFEQTTEGSSSKINFFYDPDRPLLPIKIVKTRPGKKPTTMLLQSVGWR